MATATNGNGKEQGMSGAQQILALQAAFRDRRYDFRHIPQSKCAEMRWQCGRTELDAIDLPDGQCVLLERFHLIAWGATAQELIDQLAANE